MRSFLPFAALVGVALVLGCQDVGTGPDGLVPQFNKPLDLSEDDCDDLPGFIFDEKGHCHAGDEPEPEVAPGSFFFSPGNEGQADGYTCDGGAAFTAEAPSFGQVTWKNIRRQDNHIHGDITLSGVDEAPGFEVDGTYQIVGNQDVLCGQSPSIVDFHLRHGHTTFRKIDASGALEATIGLTFGSELQITEGHDRGTHQLWLTIRGPGILNTVDPHRVGDVYHNDFGDLTDADGNVIVPDMVLRSTAVVVVIKKHSGHP